MGLWSFLFRKELAITDIGSEILQRSMRSAVTLEDKPDKETTGMATEFAFLYLHMTDRFLSPHADMTRRTALVTTIGVPVIDFLAHKTAQKSDDNRVDLYRENFLKIFNFRSMEYSACVELMLSPEQDTSSFEKEQSGAKSKSVLGLLADNLAKPAGRRSDALFALEVAGIAMDHLTSLKKLIKRSAGRIR